MRELTCIEELDVLFHIALLSRAKKSVTRRAIDSLDSWLLCCE
jgi:hypothetical protein